MNLLDIEHHNVTLKFISNAMLKNIKNKDKQCQSDKLNYMFQNHIFTLSISLPPTRRLKRFNEIYFQSAKFYPTSLRVWYCCEFVIDQCSQKKMHLKVHMTQDIGNESYLQILYFHNNCNFSFCQKHIYVHSSTKTTSFRGNEFAVFILREQGY